MEQHITEIIHLSLFHLIKDRVNEVNKESIVVNLGVVVIKFIEKTLNSSNSPLPPTLRCSRTDLENIRNE